jgi:predicted nucleic acid-binding protein
VILLDTNVVSELVRPAPAPAVLGWLDAQPAETLFLSTISLSELLFGVSLLPDGARKRRLGRALEVEVSALFGGRFAPFDVPAARHFADLMSRTRKAGFTLEAADGQIAAIAASRGFAVATRDVRPFLAASLHVIDPWQPE